jgi:hypothetical protein
MNNESKGAAKPKTGDNATVLNRASGYSQTGKAVDSKTRSPHSATGMNNDWKDSMGWGCGGNVVGYGHGNKGMGY